MKNHLDSLSAAQFRYCRMPGDYDSSAKNPLRSVQSPLNQRLSPEIRHQLIPAEAFAQPGSHDDAARISKGSVQIHKEDILTAAQLLQKSQRLLPNHGSQPFPGHQRPNPPAILRAAGFQITDFIYGDPFPLRFRAALQRCIPQAAETFWAYPHLVGGSGKAAVIDPDPGRPSGGVIPEIYGFPGLRPGGDAGKRIGKEPGQQGAFPAFPRPREKQMALTAVPERIPDTVCG